MANKPVPMLLQDWGDAKAAAGNARAATYTPSTCPLPYYTRAQLDEIERASPAPEYVKPVDGGASQR